MRVRGKSEMKKRAHVLALDHIDVFIFTKEVVELFSVILVRSDNWARIRSRNGV